MAIVVTSQLLLNGPQYVVYKFTGVGDADESGVTKVNATSSGPLGNSLQGQAVYPGIHLGILDVWFSVGYGCVLEVLWDATSDVQALVLTGTDHWKMTSSRNGVPALTPPAGLSGATGNILFTTHGFAGGAVPTGFGSYTVIMTLGKFIQGVPPPPS